MTAPDLEQRCERYARAKLWLSAVEYVILLGTLAGMTLSGAARDWFEALGAAASAPWHTFFLYLVLVAATARLAVLPVQFVSGHVIERRFGLSRQTASEWLTEWLLGGVLFGVPLLLLATPVTMGLRWWWLLLLPTLAVALALRSLYYEWLFLPLMSMFYPV